MRFVLPVVALVVALAACHSSPGPQAPANKAPAPSYQATADDVLAFLPADADVVLGVDMIAVRGSALWHQFQPQIEAFARATAREVRMCGPNTMNTIEMTMAFKHATSPLSGVFVVRGVDTKDQPTYRSSQKNGGERIARSRRRHRHVSESVRVRMAATIGPPDDGDPSG